MAQDVILDFTTNDWNLPETSSNKLTELKNFSNGVYTIQLQAADGYYFNNQDGYLMLGKQGSSLTLPAFDFDVEKIEVAGTGTASASVKQNIYVGETAVSTETTGAKDVTNIYEIAADYQAAGNVYVLKVNSKHNTQIKKILIYKKGSGGGGTTVTVPTPTISGETEFTSTTEVSISVPDGGSTYYTIDNSTPSKANGTAYTGPFTLDKTTTVKAISYDEDDNASEVAEKTFTKSGSMTVTTIADFNALADQSYAILSLKNAKVLGAGNKRFVINDGTAGVLVFDSNLTWTKGQVLNGDIHCTKVTYAGVPEVSSITGDFTTVTDGTITNKTATPAEVIAAEYFADSYRMENVECKKEESDGRYYITVGDKKLQVYDNFKAGEVTADGKYNLVGVFGAYNSTLQFWPTEQPEAAQEITYPEAANIAAVKEFATGTTVKLTLKDAVVNYVNGTNDMFVEDATGAIDLYRLGIEAKAGDVLNGSIIVKYSPYNNLPEVVAVTGVTVADEITVTEGTAPTPKEMTIADATKIENACKLVTIKDITLVADGSNYFADADKTLQVFDKYRVGYAPNTESAMDYTGILIPFKEQFQICPTVEPTASQGGGETPATPEMIAFTDGDKAADGAVFSKGDFKLTQVDTDAKTAIDANSSYFGTAEDYQKFTHHLKTGGKSGSKNSMTLTIPSDGTLNVYVRTGSNSATDRNLVLTQDGTELYNKVVLESDAVSVTMGDKENNVYPVISVTVKAGEVTVGYPTGSLNFYGFEFIAGTSGVNAIIVEKAQNNIRYNLAGQRVDESYKGVVIMNGKKFVVK